MQNTTWQEAREAARAVDTRERRAIIRIVAIASLAVIVTVALSVTGILAPSLAFTGASSTEGVGSGTVHAELDIRNDGVLTERLDSVAVHLEGVTIVSARLMPDELPAGATGHLVIDATVDCRLLASGGEGIPGGQARPFDVTTVRPWGRSTSQLDLGGLTAQQIFAPVPCDQ